MAPPCIWTFAKMKEFKSKLGKEKNSRLVVKRGEVVTIRVPTHPEGKRVCWEFATDDYDIGFGVYFDWTPVTSTDITVQVSDSSEDEDEDEDEDEELEGTLNLNIICGLLSWFNLISSNHQAITSCLVPVLRFLRMQAENPFQLCKPVVILPTNCRDPA